VICHPAGIKHMLEPQYLWEGSLKVLGRVAREYGEIVPVKERNICFEPTLDDLGIKVFQTPGHAAHHLSFIFDDLLIGGEVAGVCCDTPTGVYMRPATPPRFDLDIALDSLHKVMQQQPEKIIFAHSTLQDNAMHWLDYAEQQLHLWVKGVAKHLEEGIHTSDEALCEAMYTWLLQHDSLFARIQSMPADIQQREEYFLNNSIKGMSGYIAAINKTRRREILARVGSDIE
jgi:glyoxylase-like metal-dependent hydrolase (beta-lactamase superfamily II)